MNNLKALGIAKEIGGKGKERLYIYENLINKLEQYTEADTLLFIESSHLQSANFYFGWSSGVGQNRSTNISRSMTGESQETAVQRKASLEH